MTGTTGRLRRIAAIVGIGLAAAAVVTGTAVAADSGGDGHHGDPPKVKGTPCTATAHSCVDLEHNQAWLIHDGKITRGPVGISHGGQGKATPTGTFHVQWKDKDHKSAEFNNAAMPYSECSSPTAASRSPGQPEQPLGGVRAPVRRGRPGLVQRPGSRRRGAGAVTRLAVTASAFREVYARNTDTMVGIATDGRTKGAVHHMFVEDENGDLMVIDEWGSSGVRGLLRNAGRHQGDHVRSRHDGPADHGQLPRAGHARQP